jgi:hypothetical protein
VSQAPGPADMMHKLHGLMRCKQVLQDDESKLWLGTLEKEAEAQFASIQLLTRLALAISLRKAAMSSHFTQAISLKPTWLSVRFYHIPLLCLLPLATVCKRSRCQILTGTREDHHSSSRFQVLQ